MDKARNLQFTSVAVAEVNFDDYVSGAGEVVISVPAGAYLTGGHVNVVTAWDSATSSTGVALDVDSASLYGNVDMKAAGITAITLPATQYADGTDVTLTITDVGAPTQGKAYVVVEYIVPGRGHEVAY
jgi:hypothetical protein